MLKYTVPVLEVESNEFVQIRLLDYPIRFHELLLSKPIYLFYVQTTQLTIDSQWPMPPRHITLHE